LGEKTLAGTDPAEAREYHLAQFRYLLVDEYQDIDQEQYSFISALTGRLERDRESSISIMAVGDDDQSIYGFRQASVTYINQFKQDYTAEIFYLVENYRSSHPIIQASTLFIANNRNRMKTDQPCRINSKRQGEAKRADQIKTEDLVQLVHAPDIASQAVFAARTIRRRIQSNPGTTPGDMAVSPAGASPIPPWWRQG